MIKLTPETDAEAITPSGFEDDDVSADFARKLERERDEAIRKLENLRADAIHSCHNECQRPICVLRRERDEARELLAKALVRGDLALEETKKAKEDLSWSDIQDKRVLQRERDEARDQVQLLRVENNHNWQANEMAEQAFRERDEACKVAGRAIDDLAWFNETNAQILRAELDKLKEGAK
jgi:hypothetical protein